MLVTDGTCKDYGPGTGLRAKVYQTEKKHYAEFLRVIPEDAVMCDELKPPSSGGHITGREITVTKDLHEIRLKARWLRPGLEAAGLYLPEGKHLRDIPALWNWVFRLSIPELRAFFSACWLSDGTEARKGRTRVLSCGSENLRRVLALAAYRLGYVATEHQPDRPYLSFREPVISTHRNQPFEDGSADVWCVTTESGTFTAMTPEGTVYLTGNSCVRPNGQQFSRQGGVRKSVRADEGYVMVNADFQGCEIRVAAALSGDRGLLEAETSNKCHLCQDDPCSCGAKHTGMHWLAAHLTFGEGATKENRYKSKAVIFRKLFGGAPDSDVAQKISDTFDNQIAPVYAAWDKWLRKSYYDGSMVWRDYQTGENYSQKLPGSRRGIYRTYNGRNIYINAPHAFGNYAIQGTARELLVEGIIRWHHETVAHPEWEAAPVLPIHDEVLTWVIRPYFNEAVSTLRNCMATDVLSVPGWDVRIDADPELKEYTYWPDSS
jgi:hypothetical protein